MRRHRGLQLVCFSDDNLLKNLFRGSSSGRSYLTSSTSSKHKTLKTLVPSPFHSRPPLLLHLQPPSRCPPPLQQSFHLSPQLFSTAEHHPLPQPQPPSFSTPSEPLQQSCSTPWSSAALDLHPLHRLKPCISTPPPTSKVIGGIAQSFLKCKENDYEAASNNELPELKDKMNLHTMEHQRHILRMLEKSLEREIEFEKSCMTLITHLRQNTGL
ncbi:putative WPP domain-interacting tail-anchored protein [Helianthus debilis subsp. tardiflorus]